MARQRKDSDALTDMAELKPMLDVNEAPQQFGSRVEDTVAALGKHVVEVAAQ